MLPCRDPLPHRDHVHEGVAVRDDDVQDLLHHDLDQPDHQLPLPHGPLRRQIHRRLPPHLIATLPHRDNSKGDKEFVNPDFSLIISSPDCLLFCLACLSRANAPSIPLRHNN